MWRSLLERRGPARRSHRRVLKSPRGAPKDLPELLEGPLELLDRTPLERTLEDLGRQDPPRTLALVCGALRACKDARQPLDEPGHVCVCVCVCVCAQAHARDVCVRA